MLPQSPSCGKHYRCYCYGGASAGEVLKFSVIKGGASAGEVLMYSFAADKMEHLQGRCSSRPVILSRSVLDLSVAHLPQRPQIGRHLNIFHQLQLPLSDTSEHFMYLMLLLIFFRVSNLDAESSVDYSGIKGLVRKTAGPMLSCCC